MRLDVHVYLHDSAQLDRIEEIVSSLITQGVKTMALLDELQVKVERNTSVTQSAVVLLKGLKQKLDEAGTDPAKLKALSDTLGTNTDGLAAAVEANTPAADTGGAPPEIKPLP